MKALFKISLLFAVLGLGLSAFAAHSHADEEEAEDSERKKAKTAGYIIGKIFKEGSDAFDEEPVTRGKTLYENEDIIIRRGYTKNGKEIKTITRK
jgi:hypothetical protein